MHVFAIEALAGAGSNVNGSLGGLTKPQRLQGLPNVAAAINTRCSICEDRTSGFILDGVACSCVLSVLR